MSWKRISSRWATLDFELNIHRKILFCFKFAKCIDHLDWIVNIDESLFSKNTRILYSWSTKGEKQPIKNINFANSVSIISAITSRGSSFNALKKGTWKSSDFKEFVKDIINKLNLWGYASNKIGIILDNWSIHRSNLSLEFLKAQKINIYFIPPYCPEIAPIEKYFSFLKSIVWRKCKGKSIDLRSKDAENIIQESIEKISWDYIISLWTNLLNEIENILKISKYYI